MKLLSERNSETGRFWAINRDRKSSLIGSERNYEIWEWSTRSREDY